jgi:hypothetical protein
MSKPREHTFSQIKPEREIGHEELD